MKFQCTFRKLDASPSLTEHAQIACAKLQDHLINEARFIVSFSKLRGVVTSQIECQTSWGRFKAIGRKDDYFAAFETAREKLERQILKTKEILKDHLRLERTKPKRHSRIQRVLEALDTLETEKQAS